MNFHVKGGYFDIPTKKEIICDLLRGEVFYVVVKKGEQIIGFCNIYEYSSEKLVEMLADVEYYRLEGFSKYIKKYICEIDTKKNVENSGGQKEVTSLTQPLIFIEPKIALLYEFVMRKNISSDDTKNLLTAVAAAAKERGYKALLAQPYQVQGYAPLNSGIYQELIPALTNPSAAFYSKQLAQTIGHHAIIVHKTVDNHLFSLRKLLNWYKVG